MTEHNKPKKQRKSVALLIETSNAHGIHECDLQKTIWHLAWQIQKTIDLMTNRNVEISESTSYT